MDAAHNQQDSQRRSDYLLLIQPRLHGLLGSINHKAKSFGLPAEQLRDLMKGSIDKFSLDELITIVRKIGVAVRL